MMSYLEDFVRQTGKLNSYDLNPLLHENPLHTYQFLATDCKKTLKEIGNNTQVSRKNIVRLCYFMSMVAFLSSSLSLSFLSFDSTPLIVLYWEELCL